MLLNKSDVQSFNFHPAVSRWFESRFGTATEPQEKGWPAIQSGKHTLISAPTGSGKTLAAFLAALDQLFKEGLEGNLPDETRVLYVSPLKALSNDIRKNLEDPLLGIRTQLLESEYREVDVRADVRTGDTPASKRQAIAKRPPHILVTTPESFYLLLTSESGRKTLSTVQSLIIDEIHAVVDNRRGSHLALSIERLAALVDHPLQRIGLSATQKPIEAVARFLVGTNAVDNNGEPDCTIIDTGHSRDMDLAVELPRSPLEAVMANEVWEEVYVRLSELINEHNTTLIFVNTRRLAERVSHHLCERLGSEIVTSHHGSLSAKLRLDAEDRLKNGQLKALVATASLELGIDIGSIDLVCQIGSTRSISTFIQRVGRAEHRRGGLPKGRLFPLSRDELVECAATIRSVRKGELDCLQIPEKPLDILAQQIVACAACEDWDENDLFTTITNAYVYRNLSRKEFGDVVRMLAEGVSTKFGRKGAHIHYDGVNHRLRARRGARMMALTSGGAIPDNADYRVVLEPSETFIGTVNEDFAIESLAGDIFQLGNASWRILRINSGMVRVEDAQGLPPNIPFWLGEAPARTQELSWAVSELRTEIEERLGDIEDAIQWIRDETGLSHRAAHQIAEYYTSVYKALGVIPSQKNLVMERFFDESGGMQLIIHSPFGNRINRAWGLALRKKFCRSFNFELQAAATDDSIVISLGTQHSFPLDEVFHYLNPKTVKDLLIQALLDAPMFSIRWRWNAGRALAVLRQRGSRKNPPPLQRMEAENLLAAVFPDQLACLEHIVGDREIPDHPLVNQTIDDCLVEAMDIEGLISLIEKIDAEQIRCITRDLPEPSPLAHEILNAKPYAFLDNAPLEERRTQAVYTRRALEPSSAADLGQLDIPAIDKVCEDAWPRAENADEMHDALLMLGVLRCDEIEKGIRIDAPKNGLNGSGQNKGAIFLESLALDSRAGLLQVGAGNNRSSFWVAAEKLKLLMAIYPEGGIFPQLSPPDDQRNQKLDRSEAIRELIRGRLEASGPVTIVQLSELLGIIDREVEGALLNLESEGFVLRGHFRPMVSDQEWCDRRLLARIHKLTINKLRAEIQPVSVIDFYRFLLAWQRVDSDHRVEGPEGLEEVLGLFDGYELPVAAWEPHVLGQRVKEYDPQWLDRYCFSGRVGWGRLTIPQNHKTRAFSLGPLRSSPMAIFKRENLPHWLALTKQDFPITFTPDTQRVWELLNQEGAMFYSELVGKTNLLPTQIEQALGELAALGFVTADSFDGLRALLIPSDKRPRLGPDKRKRKQTQIGSIEFAGRWSVLRKRLANVEEDAVEIHSLPGKVDSLNRQSNDREIECFAKILLRRYGIVFRRLLEREALNISWYELGRVYRRMEARGEIRGGHFIAGVSGEQFALTEAIGFLRSIRKMETKRELITLNAADPLNLVGILTPGPRVAAISANRILLLDGLPIAALVSGEIIKLDPQVSETDAVIADRLKIGKLPVSLRPYYA